MSGILADEMGLGKTIQIIALISFRKNASAGLALHCSSRGFLLCLFSPFPSFFLSSFLPPSLSPLSSLLLLPLYCGTLTVVERKHGPHLVVAPLSTLGNWRMEFHRFAPSINTVVYRGTKEERAALREEHFHDALKVG